MTGMIVMALWMFVLYYATIPKMNGGPFINLPNDKDRKMANITHAAVFIGLYLLTVNHVVKMASNYM